MSNILMVYGSTHGQTGKIVQRLADRLTTDGHRVTVWKGDAMPGGAIPEGTDLVLVAGSVTYGRYQPCVVEFVRAYRGELNRLPTVFLSVCGVLIGTTPDATAMADGYIRRFVKHTGWQPRLTRSFPGALAYTRYTRLTRWIMKLISARTGRPTDTSRDWDCTNWGEIDRFAMELESLLPQPAVLL